MSNIEAEDPGRVAPTKERVDALDILALIECEADVVILIFSKSYSVTAINQRDWNGHPNSR
jgi:hypothetical protein